MKICTHCRACKPLTEFSALSRGGHKSKCKRCSALIVGQWFQANKARRAAYLREYRAL